MDQKLIEHLEDCLNDINVVLTNYPIRYHQELHDKVFDLNVAVTSVIFSARMPLVYHKPHNSNKTL